MFRRRPRQPEQNEPQTDPSDTIAAVTDANFASTTVGGYTVVDFWAPWCGPCRSFAPTFAAVAKSSPEGVRFANCNVDENPHTAALLQIASIPTVVVFGPEGSEVTRRVGGVGRRQLEQLAAELAAGGVSAPTG